MWPGRPRSDGRVADRRARMWWQHAIKWIEGARGAAVAEQVDRHSEEGRRAQQRSVVLPSIMLSPSSAQRFSDSGAHSTPRPSLSMKFTISGVIFSAATMKSPSFAVFVIDDDHYFAVAEVFDNLLYTIQNRVLPFRLSFIAFFNLLIAGRMRSFNALSLPAYQSVSSNAESLVAL